ncbi:hypothetical protein COY44_01055 [Candidatus Berkelbacteria bacterium CG_4_10_14_0_8_um_filter_39_42]|nr:MAG: hypothetical protein COZ62_02060 [Candidatus Berkelbacteria bacterium CG_4_8_14_3_um_filter_39_27]PIZ29022.1 MAG: hypothetical protein COY44_01055 [Candidatus Berkelbacteria bacterium CG_4_10_14_0_8_um_filter_39_42]
MRSSLFGFIGLILLIGLSLFYRTFACFATKQRKANLGRENFALLINYNKCKIFESHTRCYRMYCSFYK